MNNYQITWKEKHSVGVKATSEKEALEKWNKQEYSSDEIVHVSRKQEIHKID